jgi:hypothetical protein
LLSGSKGYWKIPAWTPNSALIPIPVQLVHWIREINWQLLASV